MRKVQGHYMEYLGSYSGTAQFRIVTLQTNNRGRVVQDDFKLEIQRSDLSCIVHALKKFADAERAEVAELLL